jgi:hypothetical protein
MRFSDRLTQPVLRRPVESTLAPTIRMMHLALGCAPPRHGQAEGVGAEGIRDALAHRPADGTAREEI